MLGAITKALASLQLPPHEVAVVSGIGCSSRIPAYTTCYGFHGVHGRALAAATGLKVARPDLTVLVTGGDGDGYSIGGNHFMHACRRNVDLTYIVMDNHVYGMTKGQASPTTEPDWDNKLSPGGTGMRSFHPLVIALAAGANFVARAFSGDPNGTAEIIAKGIRHPGFSFIEILSPCVTFRPEQREWKKQVHPAPVDPTDDAARAARRIMTDDGFNIGVLYAGQRKPYAAPRSPAPRTWPSSKRSSSCEPAGRRSAPQCTARSSRSRHEGHRRTRWTSSWRRRWRWSARPWSATPSSPTRWRCTTTARWPRCSAPWRYEGKHAEQIMAEMGWTSDPPPPAGGFGWPDLEAPETVPIDEVHYLMQPWHALQLALAAEQRAEAFFGRLAQLATSEPVRRAALELQDEEPSTSSWCRPG